MNKRPFQLLILAIAILAGTAAAGEESTQPTRDIPSLFNLDDAGRLLLVGFEDRSIDRATTITSVSTYRRRGHYQSSTWSQRISDRIAADYRLQKMAEWPMTEVGVHCVVYLAPTADSAIDTIHKLSADKRVKVVQKMNLFTTRTNAGVDPYLKLQSNLQAMQIHEAHAKSTGRNVTIGMIDTGVDIEHPDLSGQIAQNENFAEDVSPSFAADKHGTAIAGIMVAKKDNGTGITGVAPNARLVALKACWPDRKESMASVCNSYTLALAVNNAIKAGVKVLNMSLTGPYDPLLELLLHKAIADGIVVVAADNGAVTGDGNFPAAMAGVIAVESSSALSSSGQRTIAAPGERILTTQPHGTYDFISGSSMAAAEVSGIVALMLELKPDLTIEEIKNHLQPVGLKQKPASASEGINALHTLMALCKTLSCDDETLSYARRSFELY